MACRPTWLTTSRRSTSGGAVAASNRELFDPVADFSDQAIVSKPNGFTHAADELPVLQAESIKHYGAGFRQQGAIRRRAVVVEEPELEGGKRDHVGRDDEVDSPAGRRLPSLEARSRS